MWRMTIPALALALAACTSGDDVQWTKTGATEQQLRDDRAACEREARRFGFLDPSRSSFDAPARDRSAAFSEADSYRTCMQRLGWRRERVSGR